MKEIKASKRHLHQRFGEHRDSILNYGHFLNPTPVSQHFWSSRSLCQDVILIPLEIIRSNRDLRKALKAHLIDKAMTLEPHGINRRDEFN